MKKNFFYIAALAVITAACTNEDALVTNPESNNGTSEGKMITETITATNGDAPTRAAIADADGAFTWSKDDQIAVHADGKYYTTEALTANSSDENATFTVTYSGSRDAFAVFPASIVAADAANYGQSGTALDVTLPSSYTLAQVSGTATPCPMIATNTPGSGWTFSQLCGLLRLTVNGIPSDATGMIIQFPGKKVNGTFSVASPVTAGTSTIATDTPADGEDKITVTFDAGITTATVNIPLPTGTYEYVYITPVVSATKVAAIRNINNIGDASYVATRAHGKKLTTAMVSFSVSSTKKVFFAPGNLVKTEGTVGVDATYSFETTPFNTNGGSLGYDGSAPSSTSARGYFTWGEIATANETPREFTVNGVSGWKALTDEEWDYLQLTRYYTMDVHPFYRIDLEDSGTKIGFLLSPDEATLADVAGLTEPTIINGSFTQKVDVDIYISKGFVFLPAAGWYATSWLGYWAAAGEDGYYWTTYTDGDYYYRHFNAAGQGSAYDADDFYNSVRLVHE